MMMALGIAGLSTNFVDGYTAGFFQLISHALFKASLFMGAGALLHTVGSRYMTDMGDRKSTRLNSSHMSISYAVFCLKKKNKIDILSYPTIIDRPARSTLFPYTTLFRSHDDGLGNRWSFNKLC